MPKKNDLRIVARNYQWVIQRWVVPDLARKRTKIDSKGAWRDSLYYLRLEHAAEACVDLSTSLKVREEGMSILAAVEAAKKEIERIVRGAEQTSGGGKKRKRSGLKVSEGKKRKRSSLKVLD